jgi:uncharacterized protein
MKIDIHAHTSNNQLWDFHVKTATIADLEALAQQYDINQTVLVATYFPFKKGGLRNRELLKRTADHPQFLVFGSLDAMDKLPEGLQELAELAEAGMIAGIKLYPGYQDFDFGSEAAYPIYKLAKKYGLPVMFHSGELHKCCPKDENQKKEYKCKGNCRIAELQHLARPRSVESAVNKFSSVRFIFSHLGNPYFDEMRSVMERCQNVFTDISGQFVSGSAEDTPEYKKEVVGEIRKFLELPGGIDRILFGTDFPVQSYADSIALVKALNLSKDEEDKIFFKNAARILRL